MLESLSVIEVVAWDYWDKAMSRLWGLQRLTIVNSPITKGGKLMWKN